MNVHTVCTFSTGNWSCVCPTTCPASAHGVLSLSLPVTVSQHSRLGDKNTEIGASKATCTIETLLLLTPPPSTAFDLLSVTPSVEVGAAVAITGRLLPSRTPGEREGGSGNDDDDDDDNDNDGDKTGAMLFPLATTSPSTSASQPKLRRSHRWSVWSYLFVIDMVTVMENKFDFDGRGVASSMTLMILMPSAMRDTSNGCITCLNCSDTWYRGVSPSEAARRKRKGGTERKGGRRVGRGRQLQVSPTFFKRCLLLHFIEIDGW